MGPTSGKPLQALPLAAAVAQAEDLLLLSRYEEAADSAASVLPGLVELAGKRDESPNVAGQLLQRALVAAIQAHFFCGRYGACRHARDRFYPRLKLGAGV